MTIDLEKRACTKCGAVKPRHWFHAKPNGRDGLQPHCRDCVAGYGAEYRARLKQAQEKLEPAPARGVVKDGVRWRERAACANSGHPELWFPDEPAKEQSVLRPRTDAWAEQQTEMAKAECAKCPVWAECLSWALDNREHGIWGGTTTKERRAILKREQTERLRQRASRKGAMR